MVLATPRFLPTVSPVFNAAPRIVITAATTSYSWVPWRLILTTERSRFCLRAADTGGFSLSMTLQWLRGHEQEGPTKACEDQAKAAVARRPAQGICHQSYRVLRRRRIWRRHARTGATAWRDPTAALPIFSQQGRFDKGSLSHGLSRTVRYRLGEIARRSLAPDPGAPARVL